MPLQSCQQTNFLLAIQGEMARGKYSDLTVKCGNNECHGHKFVYGTASKKLEAAFVEEGRTATITFPRHYVEVVGLLHQFLYERVYTPIVREGKPTTKTEESNTIPDDMMKLGENDGHSPQNQLLIMHARVFRLADEYGMEDLKSFANNEFFNLAKDLCEPAGFEDVIEKVYASNGDGRLRQTLVFQAGLQFHKLRRNTKFMSALAERASLHSFSVNMLDNVGLHLEFAKADGGLLSATLATAERLIETLTANVAKYKAELARWEQETEHEPQLTELDLQSSSHTLDPLMQECSDCTYVKSQVLAKINQVRANDGNRGGWQLVCATCQTKHVYL